MSKINKEKLKESSEEYKEASLLHNLLKSSLQEKEEDWDQGFNKEKETRDLIKKNRKITDFAG